MAPRKARVWLVATLKGGVRKSTTAVMLGCALAGRGREVLVVDADAGTQGVTDWASRVYARGEELPFDIVQWTQSLGLLVPYIQRQAQQSASTHVLVDVGGEAPEVVRQCLHITDLVISPTGAEQAELGRIGATAELVRPAGVPMHVLLTRVPRIGAGSARDARESLTEDGHQVLTTEIPQDRDTYAHVWGHVPSTLGAYDTLADELLRMR